MLTRIYETGAVRLFCAAGVWLVLSVGCREVVPNNPFINATPSALDLAWASVNAAAAVTMAGGDVVPPPPDAECGRCGGTGRIRPDGRIEVECPDCGGDGKLGYGDLLRIVRVAQTDPPNLSGVPVTVHKPQLVSIEPTPADERSLLAPQPASPIPPMDAAPAAALSEPARQKARTVRWYTSLAVARAASQTTGKPALVYWYGDNCRPCRTFERKVLNDRDVVERMERDFVCAKLNAEALNRSATGQALLRAWNVTSIPQVCSVAADWKTYKLLKRTEDPREFSQQLHHSRHGTTRAAGGWRPTTSAPPVARQGIRTAHQRTSQGDDDPPDTPLSIPLETTGEGWKSRPARRPQSVHYGCVGGTGGYQTVPTDGGYGSHGGSYRVGYGSTGGTPASGSYHLPRAYYPSGLYYQPTYYGSSYGNAPTLVCGPWGCTLQ